MTRSRGRSIAAILAASALAAACTATVMPGPAQSSVSPAPSARPEMDATIYFARERQAPLGVVVRIQMDDTATDRIWDRVVALQQAPVVGPSGSFNVVRLARPPLREVTLRGPFATLDFEVDDRGWGLTGPGHVGAYTQQLVYTVTDEPGIGALTLTMNGGIPAILDGVRFERPLTRDSVLPPPSEPGTVWFARDLGLPLPVIAEGAGTGRTPAERIRSRIETLMRGPAVAVPEDAFNTLTKLRALLLDVVIEGDLAVLDFAPTEDGWGLHGAATLRAFVQQIVFTVTEEQGITRVLITENGTTAVIGGEGLVVDRPITRTELIEDAYGTDQRER